MDRVPRYYHLMQSLYHSTTTVLFARITAFYILNPRNLWMTHISFFKHQKNIFSCITANSKLSLIERKSDPPEKRCKRILVGLVLDSLVRSNCDVLSKVSFKVQRPCRTSPTEQTDEPHSTKPQSHTHKTHTWNRRDAFAEVTAPQTDGTPWYTHCKPKIIKPIK